MNRILVAAVLLLSSTPSAHAWSDGGHRIIASIAFRQLTPAQQAKVIAILKQHPRYEEDFKSKMPDDATSESDENEFLFQQAAVWPDIARGFRGDDRKYHHATWHYLDLPSYLVPEDATIPDDFNKSLVMPNAEQESMNAVQAIKMARKKLADKNTPDPEKAIWICWLFHVVGDIHQPLHSTALISGKLFPKGDRGGNSIKTTQRGNLHSLWDGFPGGRIESRTARNRAIAMVNDTEQSKAGKAAVTKLDEKTWLDESHKLCDTVTYDAEVRGHLRGYLDAAEAPAVTLTERYLKEGGRVSERRVMEAGYRLGAVVNEFVQ